MLNDQNVKRMIKYARTYWNEEVNQNLGSVISINQGTMDVYKMTFQAPEGKPYFEVVINLQLNMLRGTF